MKGGTPNAVQSVRRTSRNAETAIVKPLPVAGIAAPCTLALQYAGTVTYTKRGMKPVRERMVIVRCNNCGEQNTREWRTDGEGKTVCDESVFFFMICGIYYLANGFARPLSKDDIRRRRARLSRERRRYAPIDDGKKPLKRIPRQRHAPTVKLGPPGVGVTADCPKAVFTAGTQRLLELRYTEHISVMEP
ncbi:hypothetical protein B0H16DRAFT_1698466 [Mycena metata]|uniref:GATA-type domain-containing protein n=1 Tax=Mycena metata TaxID=1033252 RepID=A0AAD7HP31_9AGAR|nr:hypothetical protein B0H16DRAFT_1698466 [Mycena metata]